MEKANGRKISPATYMQVLYLPAKYQVSKQLRIALGTHLQDSPTDPAYVAQLYSHMLS
jgi:hypothetical protein